MTSSNEIIQENCSELVLKITNDLSILTEISKLKRNISDLNKLFKQKVENLIKFEDKSEIIDENEYNFDSSKIFIEKNNELKSRKINYNMENNTKNIRFKCVWAHCRFQRKYRNGLKRYLLTHSEGTKYKCHYKACHKRFKDSIDLKRYQLIH
jgi:hypothetical protein